MIERGINAQPRVTGFIGSLWRGGVSGTARPRESVEQPIDTGDGYAVNSRRWCGLRERSRAGGDTGPRRDGGQ